MNSVYLRDIPRCVFAKEREKYRVPQRVFVRYFIFFQSLKNLLVDKSFYKQITKFFEQSPAVFTCNAECLRSTQSELKNFKQAQCRSVGSSSVPWKSGWIKSKDAERQLFPPSFNPLSVSLKGFKSRNSSISPGCVCTTMVRKSKMATFNVRSSIRDTIRSNKTSLKCKKYKSNSQQ